MNYGEKLKELREYSNIKRKISQKEVAEAIGIKRSAYNQYEQQYDIIPIKRLIQVADYFNVSIDYILGLTSKRIYKNEAKEMNNQLSQERLKNFRKELNLTQDKLSQKLNIHRSVIAKYERGITTIATPFLYTICKKYNISADYLLGRINSPKYLKKEQKNRQE